MMNWLLLLRQLNFHASCQTDTWYLFNMCINYSWVKQTTNFKMLYSCLYLWEESLLYLTLFKYKSLCVKSIVQVYSDIIYLKQKRKETSNSEQVAKKLLIRISMTCPFLQQLNVQVIPNNTTLERELSNIQFTKQS